MYGTAINPNNELEIFDCSDEEYNSTPIVLRLPHSKSVILKNTNSKIFDDPDDLMDFVKSQARAADNSHYRFFQTVAHEIIDEHLIKLYYQIIVPNA